MQNEIIETYLTKSGLKGQVAAKIREIAVKVAEFYRSGERPINKPGMSTAKAKQELRLLNLSDANRIELAKRLDKYAAMVSGAKCDGSLMTEPNKAFEKSSPIMRVRL